MKASRIVLLHDEHVSAALACTSSFADRFGGAPEVAFGFVFPKAQAAFLRGRFCLAVRFFAAPALLACSRLSCRTEAKSTTLLAAFLGGFPAGTALSPSSIFFSISSSRACR